MRVLLLVVAFLFVSCGDDDELEIREELAPIESVEVRIAESFPPQYFLDVVSGLPGGCAAFDRYDLSRAGDTIEVEVWNTISAPRNGACTAIYGTVEHAIVLGTDFQPGLTYTVRVNAVTRTFTAQ